MKKAILAIILIAALGCAGLIGYTVYRKAPEQAIVGTWNNDEVEGLYYVFNKDGTMSGKAEILSVTTGLDGTYTLDKENKTPGTTSSSSPMKTTTLPPSPKPNNKKRSTKKEPAVWQVPF